MAAEREDRILRRMIARSFPALRRTPIGIRWGVEGDDLLLYSIEAGTHVISVNDALRSARRIVLEGGIAHELCHIDADSAMGRYRRAVAWELYGRSVWRRTHEERATERRVIELGYGPHLLAFVRFARGLGYSFMREHGLLYPEIARLTKRNAR
jgi:hypothetical protein